MIERRIVFLDVDGTVIDHEQQLAPSVVEAVRCARRNGHLLFLCTGRSRTEIPAAVLDIGFDGVISAGGGFIERGDELLAEHTMPGPDVGELVGFFRENDIEYILQGLDAIYPSPGVVDRLRPVFSRQDGGAGFDAPGGLAERMAHRGPAPASGIAKATFFGHRPSTFATVRDGVARRFDVITGTIPYLGEAGGEVSPRGMNKGAAITQLLNFMRIPVDASMAIGDSSNDREMLQVVALGIAMGNADAEIRDIADEVTGSVQEAGVTLAFARHGLI